MTKKDFEGLAAVVVALTERSPLDGEIESVEIDDVANLLADFCATKNKNFNRTLFLKACGVS